MADMADMADMARDTAQPDMDLNNPTHNLFLLNIGKANGRSAAQLVENTVLQQSRQTRTCQTSLSIGKTGALGERRGSMSAVTCRFWVLAGATATLAAPVYAGGASTQPDLVARSKPVLDIGGFRFRDLNANGELDPYEDWRLPADARAADLVGRMTLDEKAGAMLIATNNPDCGGGISAHGRQLIEKQKMTRFILRSKVVLSAPDCSIKLTGFALRGGYAQTPRQMADYTNAVQAQLEAARLGIPALFKDNARNHVETDGRVGIGAGAGILSEFPKEAGLAAAALGAGAPVDRQGSVPRRLKGDMSIIDAFTSVMGAEWSAIGLRGVYGYMADLTTEPRWSRAHETFTEDADLMSDIITALLRGLQGPVGSDGQSLSPQSRVAMTIKHFPGGGPQEMGFDPHYTFGKHQLYLDQTGRYGFGYHLRPFKAAIAGGAASIMPYYGVPINLTYDGVRYDERGMAFSKQIVTDLLRRKLGFKGYVNSDSGVIETRGWGLESYRTNPETGKPYTPSDRIVTAIRSGTDVLSEFSDASKITDLVKSGRLDERADIDPAVLRLLVEQFRLGLFENPYVDASAAAGRIGSEANRAIGMDIQRRSVVLLQNRNKLLPLRPGAKVYVLGFKAEDVRSYGFNVTDGNSVGTAVPSGTDAVLIKVLVNNDGSQAYRSNDPATGGRGLPKELKFIDPRTGRQQTSWGAQDPCVYEPAVSGTSGSNDNCLDSKLQFGGAFPWESNMLALSQIAEAKSWKMTPSLADIQAAMRSVGDPRKVVISIYFRNPYVLDDKSGVKRAGALLGTFGVSDRAQLEVISGRAKPRGRLPFALPKTTRSVLQQNPDAPGYSETGDGALFPYGYGLSY